MDSASVIAIFKAVTAVIVMSIGTFAAAIAQGFAISRGMDAMSRQPEIAGNIRGTLIVGLAMIESLAIYCLLIALILLFTK